MLQDNAPVVLLDFCDTVVDFQTFDPYILFVLKKQSVLKYCIAVFPIVKIYYRAKFVLSKIIGLNNTKSNYKSFILKLCNGIKKEVFEESAKEYYDIILSKHFINVTIKRICDYIQKGYRIIILSAGCDLYISYFASEYGVKDVVTTRIEFVNGICTGRIDGKDCIADNKPIMLEEYVTEMNIKGKLEVGISDSVTDMPMLSLCNKNIVISRDNHQGWVKNTMEEIIWKS